MLRSSSCRRHCRSALTLTAIIFIAVAPVALGLSLVGGGSSLASQLYDDAIFAYRTVKPTVDITYATTSSGAGRTALANGEYDYAQSDSTLTPSWWASYPQSLCLPVLAAAVVPIYNIPNVHTLRLTRSALALIFTGNISSWNDTRIQATNPNITLPAANIRVVVRSDSSGTTHIFTSALSAFDSTFANTIGSAELVTFTAPILYTAVGNEGVANTVSALVYSIGYSVLNEAQQRGMNMAAIQNAAGYWIDASPIAVEYALYERAVLSIGTSAAALPSPSGNSISLANPSSASAWPISGFSYAIIYQNMTRSSQTCSSRIALVQFFRWFYTSTTLTNLATQDGFNTLPGLLQTALGVETALMSILCTDGTIAYTLINNNNNDNNVIINGIGTSVMNRMMNLLGSPYQYYLPQSSFTYTSSSTTQIIQTYINNNNNNTLQSSSIIDYSIILTNQLTDIQISFLNENLYNIIPFALVPTLHIFQLQIRICSVEMSLCW